MERIAITSVEGLIDHFGGPTETGRVLGGVSAQRVWNWGSVGKLPAELYLEHRAILTGLGIDAADSLWFGPKVAAAAADIDREPAE